MRRGFSLLFLQLALLASLTSAFVGGIAPLSLQPRQIHVPSRQVKSDGGLAMSAAVSRAGVAATSSSAALGVAAVLSSTAPARTVALAAGATALCVAAGLKLKEGLDKGSRPYTGSESVAAEYDAWTSDGILEDLWGEHIHLGYYSDEERKKGAFLKDNIQAQYDFIDRMMEWGGVTELCKSGNRPKRVLDVGCGIGGTSRYLAVKLGEESRVTGIAISPQQIKRATQLAHDRKITNAEFKLMDALAMEFPDNSFDLIWACESGEHMPDKKKYVEEMVRVLKPGGRIVIATWCQRDESKQPFTPKEEKKLEFLYKEWSHPHFISIEQYATIMEEANALDHIATANWAKQTLPSWRHTIWMGALKPHKWVPKIGFSLTKFKSYMRDAWCLERMHQAFSQELMTYGMMRALKSAPVESSST